ncbi:MAG: DUF4907 domain-containing protein [Chitinophagales bacterium]
MKNLIFIILNFAVISCSNNNQHNSSTGDSSQSISSPSSFSDSITAKIFQLKDSSGNSLQEWGYDISVHGKLYLHQPNIPAVSGNHGFSSEDDAKKVADLALFKIRNHVIPPTISTEELDSLGIGPYNGGY